MRFTTPLIFTIGFLALFTIGGLTGVVLSNASLDIAFHDIILLLIFLYIVLFITYKTYSLNIDKVDIEYISLEKRYNNKDIDIKDYIEQFFVGLLEGDGSITVDFINNKKKRIRFIIVLNNLKENEEMFDLIIKYIGGRKLIERNNNYVTWYATSRTDIAKIFAILAKYPLLTTTKQCQLNFAKDYINSNEYITKDKFKKLRNNKFSKQEFLINYYNDNFTIPYYFSGWLSGFIEAEGHFKLVQNTKTNAIHTSQFVIGQNYDKYLMKAILIYFESKNLNVSYVISKSNICYYKIHLSNKDNRDLLNKHLYKYPLLGFKNIQYIWWKINH